MGLNTFILSQWYREEGVEGDDWFYPLWRRALHKYAPNVPVLIVHNGGPTMPPYEDVEVIDAIDMLPHGRGTKNHYYNCWRSQTYGFEFLRKRGVENVIFIGQNLIVGTEFVEECIESLKTADILYNTGCMVPQGAFTEYMAVKPERCRNLSAFQLSREVFQMLELVLPWWCQELNLRVAPFPKLHKLRDQPIGPNDTFCFHSKPEEIKKFAQDRNLL